MIKKTSFFLLLISFLSFNLYAQDDSGFNTQGLSGGEEDNVNLYLQKVVQEDNALKTKAETFNGSRSGVYEGSVLACPYAFERDLFVGSKGEDVRLLQILLNSDKRTLIAVNGSGSVGNETTSFGESTKAAVKKFQALFIEYVGIANGRFGPRTRTVMNSICNGQNKPSISTNIETRQNRNIYDNIFSVQAGAATGGIVTTTKGVDSAPPRISLSANISSVKMGETFKVILNSSKEIVPVTPDAIIVDGGSVKEIRKLSKTSYTATININEDAKKVLVQVEADRIEDLNGNKNENASNEISVKVLAIAKPAGENIVGNTSGTDSINSLLDKIISSAPSCTYSSTGLLLRVDASGKPLNTTGCAESQTQNLTNQTKQCSDGRTVPANQQCPEQVICNTQQSLFGSSQQCQTASQAQQQARQQAQNQQDQQMGQLLGQLLGKGGFGGGQNPGSIFNQPGGIPPGLPSTAPGIKTPEQLAAAIKENKKTVEEIKKEIADCNGDKACAKPLQEQIKKIETETAALEAKKNGLTSSENSAANALIKNKEQDLINQRAELAKCRADGAGKTTVQCDELGEKLNKDQEALDKLKAVNENSNNSEIKSGSASLEPKENGECTLYDVEGIKYNKTEFAAHFTNIYSAANTDTGKIGGSTRFENQTNSETSGKKTLKGVILTPERNPYAGKLPASLKIFSNIQGNETLQPYGDMKCFVGKLKNTGKKLTCVEKKVTNGTTSYITKKGPFPIWITTSPSTPGGLSIAFTDKTKGEGCGVVTP